MNYQFETARNPVLSLSKAKTLFDGIFSEPKLSHPEGVAVGPDGFIWVGNQDGDICRIAPDGSNFQRVFSTDGFALGLAFDSDKFLFVCDLKHAAVFRYDLNTEDLIRFTKPGIKIPNYPLIDKSQNRLFVSDSFSMDRPGPGIWTFDLETGEGKLWYDKALNFANGIAKRPGEQVIYVCETFAPCITRININSDGSAGEAEKFVENLPGLPDGIAFDREGNLIVGCYEPSRLLRISPTGDPTDILIDDPSAHVFCHPTNIAFSGNKLYTANLGRWHVTEVEMDIGAEPLWKES